ncbi:MAG: protein BatD [Bacteroidales bacterium]|nr:protein BatD [Bacteroidales bacterium]
MNNIAIKYKIAFVFATLTWQLSAQIATVQARLDSNQITIGDQVHFIVEVKTEKNISVSFPDFQKN